MVEDNKNKPIEFTNKINGSSLSTDTFLEKLREFLTKNEISCSQTKEKTGEAKTTVVGATISGELGGGVAHSDIITNKWNPFNISASAKKYAVLGKFSGIIKLTEMAKYHKKKKDTYYELKDYNLTGNLKFIPSNFLGLILFCFGIWFSFNFSTGFWIGAAITIGLPAIFYAVAPELGNQEIDFPKTKINDSISQFEKYLEQHNKDTIK